jgi:hypothetical protein
MTTLIDVHEQGERIFTMSQDGVLKAHRVDSNGQFTPIDVVQALSEERAS